MEIIGELTLIILINSGTEKSQYRIVPSSEAVQQ
jgi:hypothetical protein